MFRNARNEWLEAGNSGHSMEIKISFRVRAKINFMDFALDALFFVLDFARWAGKQ